MKIIELMPVLQEYFPRGKGFFFGVSKALKVGDEIFKVLTIGNVKAWGHSCKLVVKGKPFIEELLVEAI